MSRVGLVRGSLDVMILKALTWGPKHGYAVTRWLADASGGRLEILEGVLYPALYRMEKRGLVTSTWGTSENNRQARFYEITPAGRRELAAETTTWFEYVALPGRVLSPEPTPAGKGRDA